MRKDAREAVFVLLYRDMYSEEKDAELIDKIYKSHKLNDSEKQFADTLYDTVNEHKDELLEIISQLSVAFKLNRIFPTDKCALLIGLTELKYFPDVPKIVAIDEAVNLATKYSSEKSNNFVNGILAQYIKNSEA